MAIVVIGGSGGQIAGPPQGPSRGAAGLPGKALEEQRLHPGGDIGDCLRCHKRPELPPEEKISFCAQCHPLEASHSSAPPPAHPVRFEASAKECYLCHNPHRGPEATDHAAGGEGVSLCAACHLSKDGLKSEEKVGESCAQCHNLGLSPSHPQVEEEGRSCRSCHEEVARRGGS